MCGCHLLAILTYLFILNGFSLYIRYTRIDSDFSVCHIKKYVLSALYILLLKLDLRCLENVLNNVDN